METVFLGLYTSDDYHSPQAYRPRSVKIEKKPKQINHCLRKCHSALWKPLLSTGC